MRVSLVGKNLQSSQWRTRTILSWIPSEFPGNSPSPRTGNDVFIFREQPPVLPVRAGAELSSLPPHQQPTQLFWVLQGLKSSQMMQQWTWCSCRAVGFKPRQHHPKNSFSPLVLLSCQNSVKTPFNLHKKMVFTLKSWLLGCWDARSEHPCLLLFCFNF